MKFIFQANITFSRCKLEKTTGEVLQHHYEEKSSATFIIECYLWRFSSEHAIWFARHDRWRNTFAHSSCSNFDLSFSVSADLHAFRWCHYASTYVSSLDQIPWTIPWAIEHTSGSTLNWWMHLWKLIFWKFDWHDPGPKLNVRIWTSKKNEHITQPITSLSDTLLIRSLFHCRFLKDSKSAVAHVNDFSISVVIRHSPNFDWDDHGITCTNTQTV